jgi:hypothetical protein
MTNKYILDGHQVVPCDDILDWGHWFETADRIVKKTTVGESEVSTVFIGLDHRFQGGGPPLVFESMVFGGPQDGDQERYSTWGEAERGHEALVAKLKP